MAERGLEPEFPADVHQELSSITGPASDADSRIRDLTALLWCSIDNDDSLVFQPFWQAGLEDRRGAGLGLSICRSIIEARGASVWSEAAEGMRVKICLLLPCVKPVAACVGGMAAGTLGIDRIPSRGDEPLVFEHDGLAE